MKNLRADRAGLGCASWFGALVRPGRVIVTAALSVCGNAMAQLPPPPVPQANPITEPKRVLGKILYWDEQLSSSNTIACATCHQFSGAGADPRPRVRNAGVDGVFNTPDDVFGSAGVVRSDPDNDVVRDAVYGTNAQVTGRASPSVINAAYFTLLFWDGRAGPQFVDPQTGQVALQANGALESQAVGPPLSSVEMAHDGLDWNAIVAKLGGVRPLDLATNHPADVAAALADRPSYPELFRRAFGDTTITARRIAFAIATYERTLISDQSPWDRFNAGDTTALTPQQQQGITQFQNHSCAVCHPLVGGFTTSFTFRNIGLRPPAEDLGRQIVSGDPNDRGKFKVPSLRNVGLKTSFMHNGMFTTLPQVIGFYARAPGAPQQFPDNRDPAMNAIVPLPPNEAGLIQDFIQNGLTDPRVANRTFPFDEPTIFVRRPADQTTSLGGGVTGSGGVLPRVLVLGPSMIGNLDYRIGLDGALGGAQASLAFSFNPPVNGRITPDDIVGTLSADGVGAGTGLGTLHWPLAMGSFVPGDVVFAQWRVSDPGAVGGLALSNVVRIPMFCGSYGGCPTCNPDLNADGIANQDDVEFLVNLIAGASNPDGVDTDFDKNGVADQDDVSALINVIAGGECP